MAASDRGYLSDPDSYKPSSKKERKKNKKKYGRDIPKYDPTYMKEKRAEDAEKRADEAERQLAIAQKDSGGGQGFDKSLESIEAEAIEMYEDRKNRPQKMERISEYRTDNTEELRKALKSVGSGNLMKPSGEMEPGGLVKDFKLAPIKSIKQNTKDFLKAGKGLVKSKKSALGSIKGLSSKGIKSSQRSAGKLLKKIKKAK